MISIPAHLYSAVFLYSILILTLISSKSLPLHYENVRRGNNNFIVSIFICTIFALWIGARPIAGCFGDTVNYARDYRFLQCGAISPAESGEWIWHSLMFACSQVMDVNEFLTLIDIGYFGFTLWACKRLTPNNVLISLLFCLGSLSFFSYGTNGIRNGLACSITLVVLSYINGNAKDKVIAAGLAFLAYNIHHTTALPIIMALISRFCIKSFKWAYTFWILSIFISLVAGGAMTSFFAGLGFDDRLSYLTAQKIDGKFSHMGFRWDFLIYSMMPIILGYYIVIKKGIQDRNYLLLLNTYTLANAFWVIVIRANYSNRFAYLSWFMYPFVLSYPLLRLDVWGALQGKRARQIMLAHIGFTLFMQTIYW